MNREKAIDLLDNLIGMVEDNQASDYDEALKMGIQALSQEPCDKCKYFDGNSCQHYDYKVGYMQGYENASKRFRQEPCTDAVSRDAVIYYIKGHIHEIITESGTDKNAHTNSILRALINGVETMPSVTQKSGKWTLMYEPKNMVVCSECGKCAYMYQDKTSAYCPHCGDYKVEPQKRSDKE